MAGTKFADAKSAQSKMIEQHKSQWLKKQAKLQDMLYGKSKLPPMTIEPFPYERQRLPFQMTDTQRALRKQWVQDQTVHEPYYVKELTPKNIFKRVWEAPFRLFADVAIKPVFVSRKPSFIHTYIVCHRDPITGLLGTV